MKFQKLNQKALSFFMSGLFTVTLAVSESKDFAVLALDNTTSISSSIDTSVKVKIPKEYRKYIDLDEKEYTVEGLSTLKSLNLTIEEPESLDWLKYCVNLEKLNILLLNNDFDYVKDELNKINDISFEKLKSFSIFSLDDTLVFDSSNFSFLKNTKNLEKLSVSLENIDSNFIESFTNIKNLTLTSPALNTKIDFKKLYNLKIIDFSSTNPYDLAIYITNDDIDYFRQNNIEIKTDEEDAINKVIEINNKINSVIKELEIDSNDTEVDKIEKIANYVTISLIYDENIVKMIKESNLNIEYVNDFYKEGILYGALCKDKAICGNYAALTQILANRLGLDFYFLTSSDHVWNMVRLADNNYYYLDTTYMDCDFKDIPTKGNEWFLKDIDDIKINDYSHLPDNLPDNIEIDRIEEMNVSYNELLKEYKRVNTIGSVLVGVTGGLSLLGFIACLNIYRKEVFPKDINNSETDNNKILIKKCK